MAEAAVVSGIVAAAAQFSENRGKIVVRAEPTHSMLDVIHVPEGRLPSRNLKYGCTNAAHVDRNRKVVSLGPHPQICRLVKVLETDMDDIDIGYQARWLDEVRLIYSPLARWASGELLQG